VTATPTLLVGAARSTILVAVDRLAGYALRAGPCSGVHDPLQARVTLFDDGRTTIVTVVLDLLYVPQTLAELIRGTVARGLRTEPENVLVSATHTHCGPAGLAVQTADRQTIARAAGQAAGQARASAAPAVLATGIRRVGGISADRRSAARTPDDLARIVVALTADQRRTVIASIVNFACHATVLDHTWTTASADFPGAACAQIEAALGGVATFLQGCAGDVNPVYTEPTWSECERIGGLLSAATTSVALQAKGLIAGLRTISPSLQEEFDASHLADCQIVATPHLRSQWSSIIAPPALTLPLTADIEKERRDLASSLADETDLVRHRAARRDAYLWIQELRSKESNLFGVFDPGPPARLDLQLLTLGTALRVLAIPGEPFTATGAAIRSASTGEVLIAGYAHQSIGYLPPAEAWLDGGYEVGGCLYAETVESQIRQCAIDLLG
jgi:neutral ceramidase